MSPAPGSCPSLGGGPVRGSGVPWGAVVPVPPPRQGRGGCLQEALASGRVSGTGLPGPPGSARLGEATGRSRLISPSPPGQAQEAPGALAQPCRVPPGHPQHPRAPIPPHPSLMHRWHPTCPRRGHKAKRLILGMGAGFGAKPGVGFAPGGHKPWQQSPDPLGASAVPGGPGSRRAMRALTCQNLPAPAPLLGGHSPWETSRDPSPSHPMPSQQAFPQLQLAPPSSWVPLQGGRCHPGPPWHGRVAAGAWPQLPRALRFHSPGTAPAWAAAQPESPCATPLSPPPPAPPRQLSPRGARLSLLPPPPSPQHCSGPEKLIFLTQIVQPLSLELPRVRRVLPAAGTGTPGVMATACPPLQGQTEAGVAGEGVGRAWHVGQEKGAFVWGGLGARGSSGPAAGRRQRCGNAAGMCGPRARAGLPTGTPKTGHGHRQHPQGVPAEGPVTSVGPLAATGAPTR